jgi:hypothetical protein
MSRRTLGRKPDWIGIFRSVKNRSFSRSPHGRDACVARVAMDGHPGLARSRDCEAQWVHGGPENAYPIRPSGHEYADCQ